jgi:hypothetical protein
LHKTIYAFILLNTEKINCTGLPASPPSAPENLNFDGSFESDPNLRAMKPLGVDVGEKPRDQKNNASIVAVVVVSCLIALTVFTILAWMFLLRGRYSSNSSAQRLLPRYRPTYGSLLGKLCSCLLHLLSRF